MKRSIDLPEPWEHTETISGTERDDLEKVAGSGITVGDLEEHDRNDRGEPVTRKAWLVYGFSWYRVRNKKTGRDALLRTQTFDGVQHTVTSVIFPSDIAQPELTGSDLRSLPLAAIALAYTYDEQVGRANLHTFLQLLQEIEDGTDPLDPLPKASSSAKFSAFVARQYRHIEDNEPESYVAGRMAEINNKPLPTVQRWITQSRKIGFLPPSTTGRRPNG